MLPARLDRIECDAKAVRAEVESRRELLDWFLNAQREYRQNEADAAAAKAAEEAAMSASLQAAPATSPMSGTLRSTWSSAAKLPEAGAATPKPGKMGSSQSTPLLRPQASPVATESRASPVAQRPSLLTMINPNADKSMHRRVDAARQAAERNARELSDRRPVLDGFKAMRADRESGGINKKLNLLAIFNEPPPPSTQLRSTSQVQRLSFNSRLDFGHKYSLQALNTAVKEAPPSYPVLPTSSMRSRLEACEHQVLWNHQTMSHNQQFLDDYRNFSKA